MNEAETRAEPIDPALAAAGRGNKPVSKKSRYLTKSNDLITL
ncbi:MAG: hypothetical protein WAX67_06845 [Rugosibacter sp.]